MQSRRLRAAGAALMNSPSVTNGFGGLLQLIARRLREIGHRFDLVLVTYYFDAVGLSQRLAGNSAGAQITQTQQSPPVPYSLNR